MKNELGVLFTCYNELEATKYSIDQFRLHYPNSKIYLVTESNEPYNEVFKNYKNVKVNYDEDTMTFYYTERYLHLHYRTPEYQEKIKKAFNTFIRRLNEAIEYTNSEYMLLMDPDALVRGKLNIPKDKKLLGSLANKNVPKEVKNIISKVEGSLIINEWGATPGLLHAATFKQAYQKFLSVPNLLDELTWAWHFMFAHDVIIPIIFSLVGEKEHYNEDFTECNTDPTWKTNGKHLVHHYKKYYPNGKEKFPWFFENA